MPSTKVKPSERRRCPQACGNCKRRREKCTGQQPCSRCVDRGVEYECCFSRPLETSTTTARGIPETTARIPVTAAVTPRLSTSPHSSSSISVAGLVPGPVFTGSASNGSNSGHSGPLPAPSSSTSSGSVRPERSLDFDGPSDVAPDTTSTDNPHAAAEPPRRKRRRSTVLSNFVPAAPVPHLSRLIQGGRGSLFYIGDSANLSFLQIIRRLVRESLGSCAFTDDPFQHVIVEAAPDGRTNWILNAIQGTPAVPSLEEAVILLTWYLRATNCILAMYDEARLKDDMEKWLEQQKQLDQPATEHSPNSSRNTFTSAESAAQEAIFFLIFAIGAQTSPEDYDQLAETYFNYGRYLTVCGATIEPSISTIQAYLLLTMYLLGASRRNAAFMYMGIAVRAAYALGIHRSDINAAFDPAEYALRERLWKVLRILDLFLSTSLGRPPSTTETRDTKAENIYSASNDLCAIFEAILTQVYSTRTVSTATIEKISEHHRLWTTRFASGLATDGIRPDEFLASDSDGTKAPNIGLFHLKEAYYWSIMLLSRPFLIENVSRHIARTKIRTNRLESGIHTPTTSPSPSDEILAYACIDSAIRTMSLLRGLLSASKVPKRLPFVVNSVFLSALVLGFAQFGDLDRIFPIGKSLAIGKKLLSLFGRHDAVAKRYLSIVTDLQAACEAYVEKRARGKMERHSMLIGGLFGTVEGGRNKVAAASAQTASTNTRRRRPAEAAARRPQPQLHPALQLSDEAVSQASNSLLFGQRGQEVRQFHPSGERPPPQHPVHPQPDVETAAAQQQPRTHQILTYSGIDLTPSSTDETDNLLSMSNGGGNGTLLQEQLTGFDMDDPTQQLLPHMSGLPDLILAMSPRMLSFDSFDRSLPLFPTMDGAGFL